MLFSRIRRSLRLKLILASVIIELIMLALLLGNSIRIIDASIERESIIRTESVTRLLDSALSVSLFQRDYATSNELLEKLVNGETSEFIYIRVYDDNNNLYAEADNTAVITASQKLLVSDILPVTSEITLNGIKIGFFEYGISIQALQASKTSLFRQGIIIAGIEVLLTMIFLGIVGYFLTRHISVLLRAAEDISTGIYEVKISINSTDEIGILARGFNLMAETIKDKINTITKSEETLRIRTAELESVYDSIADGIAYMNPDRICIRTNPAFLAMFGYEAASILNHTLDFLYANKEEFINRGKLNYSKDSPDFSGQYELQFKRADGSIFTGEVTASRVRDSRGTELGFIATVRDISLRKQNEFNLMEAKERAQVTLESIGDAVITTDEKGFVQYLNPVAETLTGWMTDEAKGKPLPEVFNIYNEKTNEPVENPVDRCLRENIIVGLANHTALISRDGKRYAIEDSAAPIRDKQGNILGVILVFHDVSSSRILADQLTWQASHDSLTGLVNRLEFELRLRKLLADDCSTASHALLYIDLDQFKVVNDTSGHVAGDELLKQLASLFAKHKRDKDTLARLGGDEFGLLLENCPAEMALKIAESIIADLSQFRFVWLERFFPTGASIGLVTFENGDRESIESLMGTADIACYAAKNAGRNRVHVYQQDDDSIVRRQGEMQWISKVQDALENGKFILYCQPIMITAAHRNIPNHYEILIRMKGEGDELIMPLSFLPAAERYNLMPDIDRWVISQVIEQLTHFPLSNGTVISINLSGNSLSDEKFLGFVIDKLSSGSIKTEQFCFEITETAAIANLGLVTEFIIRLKKMGCQFSLDDFGSGLSSFNYLKNLNVDYLKIDGAFIKDLINDPCDRTMVEAINQVGHVMAIKTIAEYVEDRSTFEALEAIGIDYVQGFYHSEPFPFEQLKNLTGSRLDAETFQLSHDRLPAD